MTETLQALDRTVHVQKSSCRVSIIHRITEENGENKNDIQFEF